MDVVFPFPNSSTDNKIVSPGHLRRVETIRSAMSSVRVEDYQYQIEPVNNMPYRSSSLVHSVYLVYSPAIFILLTTSLQFVYVLVVLVAPRIQFPIIISPKWDISWRTMICIK